jgi:pyruvate,water dikinase
MLLYLELRRIVIALGGQFLARGHLQCVEDVFMLTRGELEALSREDAGRQAQFQVTVQRRRLQLGRAAQRSVPDVLGWDGHPVEIDSSAQPQPAGTRAILTGRGAVPGTVQGPVRLIQTPSDFGGMRLGEVLVLASAEISSTLLFPLAAAIVDERGSLLSHATVLAREYGLPTVVEVTGAARRLHNGDLVRVDGDAGSVEILRQNSRGRG